MDHLQSLSVATAQGQEATHSILIKEMLMLYGDAPTSWQKPQGEWKQHTGSNSRPEFEAQGLAKQAGVLNSWQWNFRAYMAAILLKLHLVTDQKSWFKKFKWLKCSTSLHSCSGFN